MTILAAKSENRLCGSRLSLSGLSGMSFSFAMKKLLNIDGTNKNAVTLATVLEDEQRAPQLDQPNPRQRRPDRVLRQERRSTRGTKTQRRGTASR